MSKILTCLDLFCGAGGMSEGFALAGLKILAGIDNNIEALETFQYNHKDAIPIHMDLSGEINFCKSPLNKIKDLDIDVIIGGPPCQGFSIAGKRNAHDPRNRLYKAYIKMIEHFNPKAIILENVPTIVSMDNGLIARTIIKDFEKHGYKCNNFILKASDFGVPQIRRRAFFIGLRNGKIFPVPKPKTQNSSITTYDALCDLPLLENDLGGDVLKYINPPLNDYQKLIRKDSAHIYNHWAVDHKPKTKEIIALVPDGGNYKNLPEELRSTRRVNIAWTRMNSTKPCFTIDAGHNHHFHYKANRVPTVRECARIQSFPDSFRFFGKKVSQFKQVGNAVPPILAKEIACYLKELIS